MSKKTPKKLRQDIESAKSRVNVVRQILTANTGIKEWGLGVECYKASTELNQLIESHQVPTEYKVAVVGRFKAGKSSFVNELLGRALAGENTNPETAAVTTFRHGEKVRATIQFVSQADWDEFRALYEKEPKDPDAQRIASWLRFANKKPDAEDKDAEVFDSAKLGELERKMLGDPARAITIELNESLGKKGEVEFRRELKRFTTSTKPYHCLVQRIEISAPSALLEEGVLLVDTPGLDDTERFRVNLTERAVQDVDAVLFLTQSGAAYGQSEKDFLLTLLRKGTVKQLVFVVTQVDKTYAQHLRQAREEGEEPEPLVRRVLVERERMAQQIDETLAELSDGTSSQAMERYREQLGDVELVFTSAAAHRDWLAKLEVRDRLSPDDPGGMIAVKDTLLHLLSTESRLAATARAIEAGAAATLESMLKVIEDRRRAVHSIKNREEAERKLATFRQEFGQSREEFASKTGADASLLAKALASKSKLAKALIENIALMAEAVLGRYEADDAGRHWRTRRSGRWGHMHALQAQTANAIFPKVAGLLQEQQAEFVEFVDKFKAHLAGLSDKSHGLAERIDLGSDVRLDVSTRLEGFLAKVLSSLQELFESEEQKIIALLDEFVTDDVAERISKAREAVSDVWGTGTTHAQNREVRQFYVDARAILREALSDHLRDRYAEYGAYLEQEAKRLPEQAVSEIDAELERVQANIAAAAEAAIKGQKEAFEKLATQLIADVGAAKSDIATVFRGMEVASSAEPNPAAQLPPSAAVSHEKATVESSLREQKRERPQPEALNALRDKATKLQTRHKLTRGEGSWSFKRIFEDRSLAGAQHVLLIEPHLTRPHQQRNLHELIERLREGAALRSLYVRTAQPTGNESAELDEKLRAVASDLNKLGIEFDWEQRKGEHDRFLVLDNGVVFKLGRGLDIYQATGGLAKKNQDLRRANECEIDIFTVPADQSR